MEYTDESRTSVTLNPEGGEATRITNMADGAGATDAVNRRQLDQASLDNRAYADAGDRQTVASASQHFPLTRASPAASAPRSSCRL